MNVRIPVLADRGLESELSSHVGSASTFIIVDTETGQHHAVENENLHHTHGMFSRPRADSPRVALATDSVRSAALLASLGN